jgi:hypothetical protein
MALTMGLVLCCAAILIAEEKKDEKKKEPPKVLMTSPLGVEVGSNGTVKIRGLKLENATAVRFVDAKAPVEVKIKSKGKSEAPKPLEAAKAGDTQVEIELKLPAEIPAGPLLFVVVTPDGESQRHSIQVMEKGSTVAEKEPNGSFRKPQDVDLGKVIEGQIGEPMDVDVFRFTGKGGQMIVAEVRAARLGSALDSTLNLYDENGRILANSDDEDGGVDSILRVRLPADGVYLLSLIDANDRGGVAHPYQLSIRAEE